MNCKFHWFLYLCFVEPIHILACYIPVLKLNKLLLLWKQSINQTSYQASLVFPIFHRKESSLGVLLLVSNSPLSSLGCPSSLVSEDRVGPNCIIWDPWAIISVSWADFQRDTSSHIQSRVEEHTNESSSSCERKGSDRSHQKELGSISLNISMTHMKSGERLEHKNIFNVQM